MFNELKIEANPEATLNKYSFRLMEFKVDKDIWEFKGQNKI